MLEKRSRERGYQPADLSCSYDFSRLNSSQKRKSSSKKRSSSSSNWKQHKSSHERIRTELARTFLDQIHLEKEVEKLKNEISQRVDFTCMAAFQQLDYRNYENLSEIEFMECLFTFIGN